MFARARLPREKQSRKSAAASGWRANNVRPYKLDPAKSACQPEIKESLCTFFGLSEPPCRRRRLPGGLAGASDVSNSWLTEQLAALRASPDLRLTVLCVEQSGCRRHRGRRAIPRRAAVLPPLRRFCRPSAPTLCIYGGTEFDPAAVMADAARASGFLPVLFSVQGVMRDCAAHLCDGVPENTAVPVRCGTPLIKSFPASCSTICRRALTHWPQRRPQRWPTPAM